jgi:hypothetical protein
MKRSKYIAAVAAVVGVAGLAFAPGAARASISPSYTASGIEYSATSTEGKFAGLAAGTAGDTAAWKTTVDHQPLSPSCYSGPPGCAILPGGSLALANSQGDTVAGAYVGGSITLVRQAPGCGVQIFHVVGQLATTAGAATFDVALTHYRTSIFGSCVSFAATVGPDPADGIPGTLVF